MSSVKRQLPNDQHQAAIAAAAPSALNPFATIADVGGGGGVFTPTINSTTLVEVSQASHLPATLDPDTTYFIRGTITTSQASVVSSGNAIIGFNRDVDKIIYTGGGTLFTVTDQDFSIKNLGLSASKSTGNVGGKILDATNITVAAADNYGRTRVLELQNLLIEDSTNVFTIRGFELVDLSNCLFWYISDGTIGCQFQSCRHLEISSCEFYNWFEQGDPANIDLYRQIEIMANLYGVGNGVVNINASIVHPEIVQDGLYIDATSTTGFGTIASNTFTDTNLSTGVLANFDYNVQNNYIIQANQGIINGNAKGTLSIIGNVLELDTNVTNPQVLKPANIDTGAFTNPPTFPVATRVITSVADCSFTYDTKIEGGFFVVVTSTVEMSGNGFIACRLRADSGSGPFAFTHAIGLPEIRSGIAQAFTFSIIGVANLGDVFDVEFEAFNTSMVSTPNEIIVREFVLNGYQF